MRKTVERAVAPPSAAVAGALDYLELDPRATAAGLLAGAWALALLLAGTPGLWYALGASAAAWTLRGIAANTPQSQGQTKEGAH